MRKILMFLVLIISINSFGQTPSGYQYRTVREKLLSFMIDSSLHIPSYCGTPVGLRGGSSIRDGMLAMDTCNNILFMYSGSSWLQVGKTYTANLPIRVTGTVISVDTSVAFVPSLSTNARLKKVSDSLAGILGSSVSQKFGHPSGDFRDAVNNRTFSLAGTGIMQIDSASLFYLGFDGTGELSFFDYTTSLTRFHLGGLSSRIHSPNGVNTFKINNDSSLFNARASYTHNIHSTFQPFSLIDKSYADSIVAAGGGVNIYNSDGTLTGDRTVTTSTRGLNIQSSTLSGLSNLLHIDDSTTYIQGQGNGQTNFFRQQSSTIGALDTRIRSSGFDGFDSTNAEIVLSSGGNLTLYSGYQATQKSVLLNSFGMTVSTLAGTANRLVGSNASGRLLNIVLDGATITNDTLHVTGGGGGSGTVTDVSVVSANGFSGSVANSTTTPAITLNISTPDFKDWYQKYARITAAEFGDFFRSSNGAGSGFTAPGTMPPKWMFGLEMSTGTDANGFAFFYTQTGGTYATINFHDDYRYNIGGTTRFAQLSNGTNTWHWVGGFGDNATTFASFSNGIYLRYHYADSSGKLIFGAMSGGTRTEKSTSYTVAADEDIEWHISRYNGVAYLWLKIGTNPMTLEPTITTNLPSTSSAVQVLRKTAGTTPAIAYIQDFQYGRRNN